MTSDIEWLSDDEMRSIIDIRARRSLGISGKEFVRRRDEFIGMDLPDHPGVVELLMLTAK